MLRQATLASRALSVWPAHDDWVNCGRAERRRTAGRDRRARRRRARLGPRRAGRAVDDDQGASDGWALGASLSPDGRQVASAGTTASSRSGTSTASASASCCACLRRELRQRGGVQPGRANGSSFPCSTARSASSRSAAPDPPRCSRGHDGFGLGGPLQPGRHEGGQRGRGRHRARLGSRDRRRRPCCPHRRRCTARTSAPMDGGRDGGRGRSRPGLERETAAASREHRRRSSRQ